MDSSVFTCRIFFYSRIVFPIHRILKGRNNLAELIPDVERRSRLGTSIGSFYSIWRLHENGIWLLQHFGLFCCFEFSYDFVLLL